MSRASDRRVWRAVWYVLIAVVVVLSVLPASIAPREPAGGTVEHCVAYLPLAGIPVAVSVRRRNGFAAALLMVLMGVGLELIQTRIPGRAFEWGDVAANTLGVLGGAALGMGLRRKSAGEAI